jgi:hypothetical protein
MSRYHIVPYHRAGAAKMHASQTEEISEQAQYDRLHVQQAVSFFRKIPIVPQQIQYRMFHYINSSQNNYQ